MVAEVAVLDHIACGQGHGVTEVGSSRLRLDPTGRHDFLDIVGSGVEARERVRAKSISLRGDFGGILEHSVVVGVDVDRPPGDSRLDRRTDVGDFADGYELADVRRTGREAIKVEVGHRKVHVSRSAGQRHDLVENRGVATDCVREVHRTVAVAVHEGSVRQVFVQRAKDDHFAQRALRDFGAGVEEVERVIGVSGLRMEELHRGAVVAVAVRESIQRQHGIAAERRAGRPERKRQVAERIRQLRSDAVEAVFNRDRAGTTVEDRVWVLLKVWVLCKERPIGIESAGVRRPIEFRVIAVFRAVAVQVFVFQSMNFRIVRIGDRDRDRHRGDVRGIEMPVIRVIHEVIGTDKTGVGQVLERAVGVERQRAVADILVEDRVERIEVNVGVVVQHARERRYRQIHVWCRGIVGIVHRNRGVVDRVHRDDDGRIGMLIAIAQPVSKRIAAVEIAVWYVLE